jgi:hypothetical protein
MSTDVLRVSGNYVIDARNGDITLNVSNSVSTGNVFINGNLTVLGTQTSISSVDSAIKDNIIVLNSGEHNKYVTKHNSGIMIARGNDDSPLVAASLLYNDVENWTRMYTIGTSTSIITSSTQGVFNFTSAQVGSAIRLNAIRIYETTATAIVGKSRLNIFGAENPYAVISVSGTTNYEDNVYDDDDIPNKKYVDDRLAAGTSVTKSVVVGDASLHMYDPNDIEFYSATRQLVVSFNTLSNVFKLIGESAIFSGITISSSTVSVNNDNFDLVLRPHYNKAVVIESPLKLQDMSTSTIVPADNQNTIYYATPGGGGSGIYYVNTTQQDELVSRRKAIIYGIIF